MEEEEPPSLSAELRTGLQPPSPIERPGVRLVETQLAGSGLTASFRQVAVPADAAALFHTLIGEADREKFATLFLNSRHRITHAQIVSCGSLSSAPVHPREVFKAAVLANAAAIIIGHNHPSGDIAPSPDDHALTKRIEQAGELLGIPLLDSLIVSPGNEFYAKTVAASCPLPASPARPPRGNTSPAATDICRELLQDIDEVLERQGEDWWDETVTSGTHHRNRAETLLGLAPYRVPAEEPGVR